MTEKWKNVQSNMLNGVIYGVMRNPKEVCGKSHVRLSPEVFITKQQAKNYIEECRRRRFLMNDQLVIVEMRIVGGEFNEEIL